MISSSLSPNTDREDVQEALRVLLSPTYWKEGDAQEKVRRWFQSHVGDVVFFNSGRSALLAILQAFDVSKGDEVLVQAFTCVAVPNSVLWAGATPVYVDIDETYNMDPKDAEKKITNRTKVLIIQHTFGIPAQVEKLLLLAKRYKLLVIEDCAHGLGATCKGKKLGTFGDAAFFSFGRDKVVSSVWGGAGFINAKCQMTNAKWKFKEIEKKLPYPSNFWIFQQLLHPIVFSLILPLYDVGIGKAILVGFQKLHLLSLPLYQEEKRGLQPREFPKKYPNALASLLLVQLRKLDRLLENRRARAKQYGLNLNMKTPPLLLEAGWLRFPMGVSDPEGTRRRAKESEILLGNWYHNVVDPERVDYAAINYKLGFCPKAEEAARHIINLPTNISKEECDKILSCLRS